MLNRKKTSYKNLQKLNLTRKKQNSVQKKHILHKKNIQFLLLTD